MNDFPALTDCAYASASDPDKRVSSALAAERVNLRVLRDSTDVLGDIRASDFVLATLGPKASPSVLVEIGMALGLRRPILLLCETKDSIPLALRDYPALVMEGLSTDDLRLQIQAFAHPFVSKVTQKTKRLPSESDAGKSPRKAPPKSRAYERSFSSPFEHEVADLLVEAGGTVVTQDLGPHNLSLPDLAVTFPVFTRSFGPMLVELAGRRPDIRDKSGHLAEVVHQRGLQLGILVTAEQGKEDGALLGNVLVISLQRLRELVRTSALEGTLQRARNNVVHGAS